MSHWDANGLTIRSGDVSCGGRDGLFNSDELGDSSDFLPVANYADDVESVRDQIMSCIYKASKKIREARDLIYGLDSNVLLEIRARRGMYGEGECDVVDALIVVLAALTKNERLVEREDGSLSWEQVDMISFANESALPDAIGWLIDNSMSNLSQSPPWWDKFISLRNDYFHDGKKRHAMTIMAASMWCLNARRWRQYNTDEYDYLNNDEPPQRTAVNALHDHEC